MLSYGTREPTGAKRSTALTLRSGCGSPPCSRPSSVRVKLPTFHCSASPLTKRRTDKQTCRFSHASASTRRCRLLRRPFIYLRSIVHITTHAPRYPTTVPPTYTPSSHIRSFSLFLFSFSLSHYLLLYQCARLESRTAVQVLVNKANLKLKHKHKKFRW